MIRWTIKCLKSKAGSALILVMAALILLLAVSSVVVALTTANVRLSRRYSNWSKEYYWLDFVAEDRLSAFDTKVLLPAEMLARKYLQEECYKAEEASGVTEPDLQTLLFLTGAELQTMINQQWQVVSELVAMKDSGLPLTLEQERTIASFAPRVFAILYAAAVQLNLSDGLAEKRYPDDGYPAELDYNIDSSASVSSTSWLPDLSSYIDGSGTYLFDEFYDALDTISKNNPIRLKIVAREADIENPKSVEVTVTIAAPQYDAVSQVRYYAVKANPLYANALSVQGSVFFSGSDITINGDIVAAARDVDGNLLVDASGRTSTQEGNRLGVLTSSSYTHVTVNGNIYTGGDVHIASQNSSIKVNRDGPSSWVPVNELKTKFLYGAGNGPDHTYWFDLSVARADALRFAEDNVASDAIPYIYRDNAGGNVYCNNLAIEGGVSNGSIEVDGSVWTKDDIQNDGQAGTSIRIRGNYIGMTSEASMGNPNYSSAVINNALPFGGTIRIDGKYVIPGTAFYELFSGPSRTKEYYQTAESVNAKGGEFFKVYVLEEGAAGKTYYISSVPAEEERYNFFDGTLEEKRDRFVELVEPYISDYNSNVYLEPDTVRHILGVGVTASGKIVREGADNSARVAYYEIKDTLLPAVFEVKTARYGTSDAAFRDLYDPSAAIHDPAHGFYVFKGSRTITFSPGGISSGIIYCSGDLTIEGGEFRGAIICAGNVTIKSGTTITYDESVIRSVIGLTDSWQLIRSEDPTYSQIARRFFSPGTYRANTSFGSDSYVVTGAVGEGSFTTRYTINSWKEVNLRSGHS